VTGSIAHASRSPTCGSIPSRTSFPSQTVKKDVYGAVNASVGRREARRSYGTPALHFPPGRIIWGCRSTGLARQAPRATTLDWTAMGATKSAWTRSTLALIRLATGTRPQGWPGAAQLRAVRFAERRVYLVRCRCVNGSPIGPHGRRR
jgi:hypothetical protein